MINQSSSTSCGDEDNTNNDYNNNNHPLNFIDTLGYGRHAVLLYEDAEFARLIQFRFINNGLLKGEHCIFTTHEQEDNIQFIENQMEYNGIDVEGFKRKNLLHIYQIPDPMNHPEGELKGNEDIMNIILADSKQPFRIVARSIPEIKTEGQRVSSISIEYSAHSNFHSFPGSILCHYPVDKIEPRIHGQWLVDILQNHHAAIFAPKSGQGIAFNLR
jgi:MEDS: MEthanogen/methylotroph, DcmR Sensory domain